MKPQAWLETVESFYLVVLNLRGDSIELDAAITQTYQPRNHLTGQADVVQAEHKGQSLASCKLDEDEKGLPGSSRIKRR